MIILVLWLYSVILYNVDNGLPLWIIPFVIIATAVATVAVIAVVFIVIVKMKCYHKQDRPQGRLSLHVQW